MEYSAVEGWKSGEMWGCWFSGEYNMFAGSYSLAIDEKGRLAIPARFRQQFGDENAAQLFITVGPKPCLEIYPAAEFQRLAEEIQNLPDRKVADLLKQVFIGFAVETEIDKQGRVVLPTLLRKRVQLNGSAMLVGQITRFDVWSEDEWIRRFGDGPDSQLTAASLEDAFAALKR